MLSWLKRVFHGSWPGDVDNRTEAPNAIAVQNVGGEERVTAPLIQESRDPTAANATKVEEILVGSSIEGKREVSAVGLDGAAASSAPTALDAECSQSNAVVAAEPSPYLKHAEPSATVDYRGHSAEAEPDSEAADDSAPTAASSTGATVGDAIGEILDLPTFVAHDRLSGEERPESTKDIMPPRADRSVGDPFVGPSSDEVIQPDDPVHAPGVDRQAPIAERETGTAGHSAEAVLNGRRDHPAIPSEDGLVRSNSGVAGPAPETTAWAPPGADMPGPSGVDWAVSPTGVAFPAASTSMVPTTEARTSRPEGGASEAITPDDGFLLQTRQHDTTMAPKVAGGDDGHRPVREQADGYEASRQVSSTKQELPRPASVQDGRSLPEAVEMPSADRGHFVWSGSETGFSEPSADLTAAAAASSPATRLTRGDVEPPTAVRGRFVWSDFANGFREQSDAFPTAEATGGPDPEIGAIIEFVDVDALVPFPESGSEERPRGQEEPGDPDKAWRSGSSIKVGRTVSNGYRNPVLPSSYRWIAPGRMVHVGGFDIPEGMVYVGTSMSADPGGGWGASTVAPHLVDPRLSVAVRRSDTLGNYLPDEPSYSEMPPSCRAAYLRWLSDGRRSRDVAIGYVHLFCTGLERRLLVDAPPREEAEILVAEVVRLRDLFEDEVPFRRQADKLLALLDVKAMLARPETMEAWTADLSSPVRSMALTMKLAIAHRVCSHRPLPFEMALAGAIALQTYEGGCSLRIGATRTWREFVELARRRFAAWLPTGLPLRRGKAEPLHVDFGALDKYLRYHIAPDPGADPLPDAVKLDWTPMVRFCEQVMEDLGPYARAVGKSNARANDLTISALLPSDIADFDPTGRLTSLRTWLTGLADAGGRTTPEELSGHLFGRPGDLAPKELKAATDLLGRLGFGIAAKATTGPGRPRNADRGALYVYGKGQRQSVATAEIRAKEAALVTAVAAVMGLDGAHRWSSAMADELGLSERGLQLAPTRGRGRTAEKALPGALRRLAASVASDRRELLADLALRAAALEELSSGDLEAVHRLREALGVERRLPLATPGNAEPVTRTSDVVPVDDGSASPAATGYRIPRPPEQLPARPPSSTPPRWDGLDMDRVRRLEEETLRVADTLSGLFGEEESKVDPDGVPQTGIVVDNPFPGLGKSHASLVVQLLQRSSWSRVEFDVAARTLGLMPDGALETINEWGHDRLGGELVEDGDPLVVDRELMRSVERDDASGEAYKPTDDDHLVPAEAQREELDVELVRRIQEETERVSAVLSEVFADDGEISTVVSPVVVSDQTGGPFAGLAAPLARLLDSLVGRAQWPRAAFEELAKSNGLMPDGALEAINEWAYDRLGDELLEDGDVLVVNAALLIQDADRN